MASVSAETIARAALRAGFDPDEAVVMTAIAFAESSGDTHAVGDGGTSFGLWQIHSGVRFPGWNTPDGNARAAMLRYKTRGFEAWCTWERQACSGNGRATYRAHLGTARAAVSNASKRQIADDIGGFDSNDFAITTPGGPAKAAAEAAASGILGPLIDFVKTNTLRAAEVLGGFALFVIGLLLLAWEAIA